MRTVLSGIQILVIATVFSFVLELSTGELLLSRFALWPLDTGFMPWQLVTYAFLHANIAHLAFNMIGLWMFGRELEQLLGRRLVVQLYFASVLSAAGMQLLVTSLIGSVYPTIGASGGVL